MSDSERSSQTATGLKWECRGGIGFSDLLGPAAALPGKLSYRWSEYGLSFDPASRDELTARSDHHEIASIALGTRWGRGHVAPAHLTEGEVTVQRDRPFVRAVAYEADGKWSTVRDPDSGWLRVSSSPRDDDDQVLIATGVAIGLRADELNTVWLQPQFTP